MRKIVRTILVFFVVIVLIVPIFAGAVRDSANKRSRIPSGSRIIYVKSGVTARNIYPTIQAAVNAASSGYTVFVYNGSYDENVNVGKSLTIMGENEYSTFVNASNSSDHVFSVTSDRVAIIGFTIQGATTSNYGGISIDDSESVLISENIITGNNDGIRIWGSITGGGHNTILYNNISGNKNTASGIYIVQSEYNVISDNLIKDNGNGIWVYLNSTNNEFYNNEVSNNAIVGISASGGSINNLMFHNNIVDNTQQVTDANALNNYWHNTTSLEGNYWSDYSGLDDGSGSGKHATSGDGIGDTAIPHPGTHYDFYPLMRAYSEVDTETPEIVGRIVARNINETSTKIVWTTDEQCDSVVQYSLKSNIFTESIIDPQQTTTHAITLDNLLPSTTYNYFVSSKDATGNEISSKVQYFRTSAEEDNEAPTIDLIIPDEISGVVEIFARVLDNIGVERVEFYIDDEYKFTDFSGEINEGSLTRSTRSRQFGRAYDFSYQMDTTLISNGEYELMGKAFDYKKKIGNIRKTVTVNNPELDLTPPFITITLPQDGDTVSGDEVIVSAAANDPDTGIKEFIFYVDDDPKWTDLIVGEPDVTEVSTFYWNSWDVINGEHTVSVKAYNNDLYAATDSVDVEVSNFLPIIDPIHPIYMPLYGPNLEVTRGEVRQFGNGLSMAELNIKNVGFSDAKNIVVSDFHRGFQAYRTSLDGTSDPFITSITYDPVTRGSTVNFEIDTLSPGATQVVQSHMVPILFPPSSYTTLTTDWYDLYYEIGDSTDISYQDIYGNHYPDTGDGEFEFYIAPEYIYIGYSNVQKLMTPENLLEPIKNCDYLVVTHPEKLFDQWMNWDSHVNELLWKLGLFASLKNAVLGYLTADNAEAIKEQLQLALTPFMGLPMGCWNYALSRWRTEFPEVSSEWTENGYMLLVGETEIIPSFKKVIPSSNPSTEQDTTINLSDHDYSDIAGDTRPDIILGRIIGDKARDLVKPIEASIGVSMNLPDYHFDRSNALFLSGPGKGFWWSNNNLMNLDTNNILDDEFNVEYVYWTEHVILNSFDYSYSENDAIAVGNIGGDEKEEILIADESQNIIKIYNPPPGGYLTTLDLTDFGQDFNEHDKLAVGDLDDNGIAEILIVDWSYADIEVFKCHYLGGYIDDENNWDKEHLDTISPSQFPEFGIDIGDVRGDAKNEIIIADWGSNKVKMFEWSEAQTLSYEFNYNFDDWDHIAVGDIYEGGKEEIVIADISDNYIHVLNSLGNVVVNETNNLPFGFEFDVYEDNVLMVGDATDDSNEEILIINHSDNKIAIRSGHNKYQDVPRFTFFELSDGFALGDVEGDSRDEIFIASDISNCIIYIDTDWRTRMYQAFVNNLNNQDLIYFIGHGLHYTWNGVLTDLNLPNNLGGTNPIVFSCACFTGDYEKEEEILGAIPINSIAEGFLKEGASVYIGHTQTSKGALALQVGEKFFENFGNEANYWIPGRSIGEALTLFKRDYMFEENWWFWIYETNLYGDPKFGNAPIGNTRSTITNSESTRSTSLPPPTNVTVEIPDFEISKKQNLDFVEIPGGRINTNPNEYQIPYYTTTIDYPNGFYVQDVILKNRSGLLSDTGLTLPITEDFYLDKSHSISSEPEASNSWIPKKDYHWYILENPDSSTTLVINIYPFHYNPSTTDVKFYSYYEFDIDYIQTTVHIRQAFTDKYEYAQGEIINIELELANLGFDNVDITLSAIVESGLEDTFFDGLPLQTLDLPLGNSSTTLHWNSIGFLPGEYILRVELRDFSGNLFDIKIVRLKLGVNSAKITSFSVSPGIFSIGDSVSVEMAFKNTGTVNISGTSIITIVDSEDNIIMNFIDKFTDLNPEECLTFNSSWYTNDISKDVYRIQGKVLFDSKCALSSVIELKDFSSAISELKEIVNNLETKNCVKKILDCKLRLAEYFIAKSEKFEEYGKELLARIMTKVAIIALKCFNKNVIRWEGRYITEDEAYTLISKANLIIENL